MATFFLVIIFILYIGLGLPDSSFGTAIPAMWQDLGLPLSLASVVSLLISIGTTVSAFFSAKLLNKFGTGLVVACSTLLSALSLLGFAVTYSFWWICLLSLPLGLGAGAIDSAINSYVVEHYSSSVMSFLHCFYGIGISLTPFVFSFTLAVNNDWRLGYTTIFYIQLAISAIAFIVIPLWNKTEKTVDPYREIIPVTVSYKQLFKTPAIRSVWLAFFSTCALEFTCDTWGATFLVAQGLTEAVAARFITFYYIGMTLGRFLSGIMNTKLAPKTVISLGYSLIAVGIAVLFIPLSPTIKGVALFLIGLGNGPTFPNLTFVTPSHFGKKISKFLVSSQMVASNVGIMLIPPLFGIVADNLSVNLFPPFIAVLFVILTISTFAYFKRPKTISGLDLK